MIILPLKFSKSLIGLKRYCLNKTLLSKIINNIIGSKWTSMGSFNCCAPSILCVSSALKWNDDSSNNDNAFDAFVLVSFFLFITKEKTRHWAVIMYIHHTYIAPQNVEEAIREIWAVSFSTQWKCEICRKQCPELQFQNTQLHLKYHFICWLAFYNVALQNYYYYVLPLSFLYPISFYPFCQTKRVSSNNESHISYICYLLLHTLFADNAVEI